MPADVPAALLGLTEPSQTAPESRLTDAEDGRKIVNWLIDNDRQRSIQRALVKGNLDGNPPYGGRKPSGQKWEADLNFMTGKARVNRAVSTYSALFASVENYADVATGFQPDNPEKVRWNETISVEFHNLIKTWGKGYDFHQQHRIKQMNIEGFAPVIREQGDNWRFRALDSSAIKVPSDTPACLDDRCPYVVLLESMSVLDLWAKIQNEETSKTRGWNTDSVKAAIKNAGRGDWKESSWERWQEQLQRHDLSTSETGCDRVAVAHIYVREFAKSGQKSISYFVVTLSGDSETKGIKDFLFRHVRCYDSYDECVHVFFTNIGDGTWHSVRGLAFDSFKHDVAYNRAMCRLLDRAFIDSTAFMESPSQNNSDKLDNVVAGPAIVRLPAMTKIVQTGFAGNLNGIESVIRLVSASVNGNTGASNPRTLMREDGKGEMPTLGQVKAQIQQDTQLSSDQIRMDYLAMDRLYFQMCKCAARKGTTDKEAQEFQDKCIEKGVPREALDNIESVTANRSAGYGSGAMKDSVIDSLMPVVPMLPEQGKHNFLNFFIMAKTENPEMVNYLNPTQKLATPDDALIVLENAAIQQGEVPVIFSGQNHVGHMEGHLADTEEKLGPLQEAMEGGENDPAALQSAYQYLEVMGPHLQAHLEPLRNDPTRKQLAAQFEDQLANLVAFHGKLRQAIRTAMREQEIAQQEEQNATALGVMDQARYDSAKLNDQIKVEKAQNDIRLKQMKALVSNRISTFKATQTNSRDTLKTIHQIGLEKAKAKSTSRNGDN